MNLARRSLLGAVASLPFAGLCRADQSVWPGALEMGTGLPGAAYAQFGPAWGRLITQETGVTLVYRSTDGSDSNLLLIEENIIQLGLCSLPLAIEARNGTGDWTAGAKLEQFRVLFPTFPSVLQIVSTADGVKTLAELQGQSIGLGLSDAVSPGLMKQILINQGITPGPITQGHYAQQISELLRGELAACAFFGAPPIPALKEATLKNRLRLIGFSKTEADQASNLIPGLTYMVLKAGTFPGQTLNVGSLGTMNLAVSAAHLPNSLAEKATLAALRHRPELANSVPAASASLPLQLIYQNGLAFHPGAVKALRKLGYAVPTTEVG